MHFQFYPLRFEFLACESIHFPPGKAANVLRGAFGIIFQSEAPQAYTRVFQPVSAGAGPSGLADSPRPFVFRARHLDSRTLQPGESFHFDVHIFMLEPEILEAFVRTFAAIGQAGLGPRRGKAELQRVRRLAVGDAPECEFIKDTAVEPVTLNLETVDKAPNEIRVDFLSPTELKHNHRIADRPEFPILFGRIRDRVSTLRELYGPGPLAIDFQAMGERAEAVRMTNCNVGKREVERHSTRTGQSHSIGGFTGFAEYRGELGEFLPYLEAACWLGVGRQAVWGKGEISLRAVPYSL